MCKGQPAERCRIWPAEGGISALLGAMQRHPASAKVQAAACYSLCYLTANPANRVRIAAEGGIGALLGAMQRHPASAKVQESACITLWNLVGNADNKVKVKSAGAEDAAKRAMALKDATADTKEWGRKLLDRLKNVKVFRPLSARLCCTSCRCEGNRHFQERRRWLFCCSAQ
jgi:hypothetical protein